MTAILDRVVSAIGGALDPRTEAGELTPELRMHLLERRFAYMNRRTKAPLIRLWDKEFNFIARVENLDKWDWEELAQDDGEAHITFSGRDMDWLREVLTYQIDDDEDIHVTIDPDPDKPHDWRMRWGGKVVTIEGEDTAGAASVTTLNCISNRRHLKGIYLAANPIFPMEVQLPKMFLWGGPTVSTCAISTFINCFRLFTLNGFYPIPRNLFAPETWLQNLSPLNWPVQVMPVNPILDQSRWCTIGARWKDAHTVLSPVMQDAGVICRAYTWLPGDPPPYTMFGDELAEVLKPTRACVILSFENKSGVTGPTGTLVDGALNLFAATLDDLITETIIPLDTDRDTETDPFFRKLLLVAPQPTPFVHRDVGYGNVRSSKFVIHKSQATDIIVGGKSPQWVNQAITFAIRYGISQLAQVVLGQEAPGVEGLDNIYQGQLDDVFVAFQRFVNPLRSSKAGSYAFREYFHQGHGSAYTLNAVQDIAAGDHAMKAYRSQKFDVGDGQPYILGEDYWLGDRVAAEIRGVTYTENVWAIRAEGSRTDVGRPIISFGDDTREEDPVARGFRTMSNIANFAALLAGSGDLF
ncbi:hypothetical protein LV457_02930 [Mycobacterium sp. MYCO198283]|uniref:Gp37-like protein n=1 Tax=Mycobacterium sp. MYCO198283 TaxID=2883505 RepID=UPI001E3378E1|nr:hypothetical protein [Mycobacterium sp. MYCO198283]MCG5431244.1 hypothetical protein [Mycobacterium sp. MYCO198283]